MALGLNLVLSGCGSVAGSPDGKVLIVAAEDEYGNVAAQIGGRYVSVTSVETNPNADPHAYEVSSSVAAAVAGAGLVIQNGAGYDDFMSKVESASSGSHRTVVDVQELLHLPSNVRNPHLWYKPATMPMVARVLAADLSRLQPAHAPYFRRNASRFDRSLKPWLRSLARLRSHRPAIEVATTEPVADYLLSAAGIKNLTPFSFQADVMNGIDPAPQAISAEDNLFTSHRASVFIYNVQVTDSLTQSFIGQAQTAGVPVVGVYETMPSGYTYQRWMGAETHAIELAVTKHQSTMTLK